MESSAGFAGPYPSEAPTPQATTDDETSAGATQAPPEVPTTPQPKETEAAGGATQAGPTVASTVGSSSGGSTEQARPGAGLAGGAVAAGYSGTQPTLGADPTEPLETQLEHVGSVKGGSSSLGYTGALPAVPTTPRPSLGPVSTGNPAKPGIAGSQY